jgi:preprotein translocase subunit SecG
MKKINRTIIVIATLFILTSIFLNSIDSKINLFPSQCSSEKEEIAPKKIDPRLKNIKLIEENNIEKKKTNK